MEERSNMTSTLEEQIVGGIIHQVIRTEEDVVKRSQYRNMRILSTIPDIPIPLLIMRLIHENQLANVSNCYGNRVQTGNRAFVPFVYSDEIPLNVIICSEKLFIHYQQAALQEEVSALFISHPKQLKTLVSLGMEELITYLSSYNVLVIAPTRLKDLSTLLNQSCVSHETQSEKNLYEELMSQLSAGHDSDISSTAALLKTLLDQVANGEQPRFVTEEEKTQGYVFQRVIIDPSALSETKVEIFGKFLWIISPQRLLLPETFTGEFWKKMRRFLPLKQSIIDVTLRSYEIPFQVLKSSVNISYLLYSKPRESLAAITSQGAPTTLAEFISKYDTNVIQTNSTADLASAITTLIGETIPLLGSEDLPLVEELKKTSSNALVLSGKTIEESCSVCERPGPRLLYMCCANSPCFECFCKLASTSMGQLRCFVCRANLASVEKAKLISLFIDPSIVTFSSPVPVHQSKSSIIGSLRQNQVEYADLESAEWECDTLDAVFSVTRLAYERTGESDLTFAFICHNRTTLDRARHIIDEI